MKSIIPVTMPAADDAPTSVRSPTSISSPSKGPSLLRSLTSTLRSGKTSAKPSVSITENVAAVAATHGPTLSTRRRSSSETAVDLKSPLPVAPPSPIIKQIASLFSSRRGSGHASPTMPRSPSESRSKSKTPRFTSAAQLGALFSSKTTNRAILGAGSDAYLASLQEGNHDQRAPSSQKILNEINERIFSINKRRMSATAKAAAAATQLTVTVPEDGDSAPVEKREQLSLPGQCASPEISSLTAPANDRNLLSVPSTPTSTSVAPNGNYGTAQSQQTQSQQASTNPAVQESIITSDSTNLLPPTNIVSTLRSPCSNGGHIDSRNTLTIDEDYLSTMSFQEIIPGLFLGCAKSALNIQKLIDFRISHILTVMNRPLNFHASKEILANLCCTPIHDFLHPTDHTLFHQVIQNINYHFVYLLDLVEADLLNALQECLPYVTYAHRTCHGRILVHCQAGISRSASVVIAYLIKEYHYSYRNAYEMTYMARPYINPNEGFVAQLELFVKQCSRKKCRDMQKWRKAIWKLTATKNTTKDWQWILTPMTTLRPQILPIEARREYFIV